MSALNNELHVVVGNIEKYRHFHRVVPFFLAQQPDVLLLQEVPFNALPYLTSRLHADFRFVPMGVLIPPEGAHEIVGLAILIPRGEGHGRDCEVLSYGEYCYRHAVHNDGRFPFLRKEKNFASDNYIQHIEIGKGGARFMLGNTHFPWTPDGHPDDVQKECIGRVLKCAEVLRPILCGDFNAPRRMRDGSKGQIWGALAALLDDNIPAHATSTLDPKLHQASRNGVPIPYVVDGVFTPRSPKEYVIDDLKLIRGLSDHNLASFKVRRVS